MTGKKILITGTNGFIGKSLKEFFLADPDGTEIAAPLRQELDLLDSAAVRSYMAASRPDAVIHCATTGGTRKTGYDAGSNDVVFNNLRMFMNLARCLEPGTRMINMGSGGEYDNRAYAPKMKEEYFDVNVPADPYGFSKYAISKYIDKTENIVCLRIFGLFGKYEDYTFKFITNAIVKNLLGLPLVINQNVRFDYLYINDFARIVRKFISRPVKYRHYNVTPTRSIDLITLAGLVNQAAVKSSEVRVLNHGLNREYTGDNARLLSEFPELEFTPHAEAIRELYAYYSENLDKLDLEAVKADPYLKNCRKV